MTRLCSSTKVTISSAVLITLRFSVCISDIEQMQKEKKPFTPDGMYALSRYLDQIN
jgi:hypothetical protein